METGWIVVREPENAAYRDDKQRKSVLAASRFLSIFIDFLAFS